MRAELPSRTANTRYKQPHTHTRCTLTSGGSSGDAVTKGMERFLDKGRTRASSQAKSTHRGMGTKSKMATEEQKGEIDALQILNVGLTLPEQLQEGEGENF